MNGLEQALEEITYLTDVFPKKAFQVIRENKEEAIPYLREAIEYAIGKKMELEEGYQRHFYALFLLGEFQDKEAFKRIMELVSLPEDEVDYLIGDAVTEGLRDILYNTYDGDIDLLKKSVQNRDIGEFVRSSMIDVLGQLYLDGVLEKREWKDFLKKMVYDGKEYNYVYNAIEYMICRCHFADMLPEIRYMFEQELLNEYTMGKYDSCVDAVFCYSEGEGRICETPFHASDALQYWVMFEKKEEKPKNNIDVKEYQKWLRKIEREDTSPAKKQKIGRNDPCPCGSGKKYKFCCMNRPKDVIDTIESPEERGKWLTDYPYTGRERIEGRVYLEDYFDQSGIEIDKILYLALMNRPGLIWKRDWAAEERRKKEYLYLAFQKWMAKMKEEQIRSFAEYDEKYSIHYQCEEWIEELCNMLRKSDDTERYEEVRGAAEAFGRI